MTEPTIEPELTLDQELRFNILVPFYGAMERKRQEDAGKLTKQDASPIYTEAIKKIERIISDQVAKAKGCTSCGKRMCDNCERLWSTYEPKDQRPNQGTIKQGEQVMVCGFHRNKSGHCISDDGTHCIVCHITIDLS